MDYFGPVFPFHFHEYDLLNPNRIYVDNYPKSFEQQTVRARQAEITISQNCSFARDLGYYIKCERKVWYASGFIRTLSDK